MEEHVDKLWDSPELLNVCTLHSRIVWAGYFHEEM